MAMQASGRVQSFPVDEVIPETGRIWSQSLIENLEWRLKRKVLVLPERNRPVINVFMQGIQKLHVNLRGPRASRTHPFIHAVHTAFSEHRPLVISPDCIWFVLAQGLSHHISENHEALRDRLVRHSGKRTLEAIIPDLTLQSFQSAVGNFAAQIRNASDPVLYQTMLCDFSTTTEQVRVASQIVLMDAYSNYFRYMAFCICGIPWITLTGTTDDWRRIRDRFEVLATYDLEWWAPRVRPILDEFVRTSEGNPDIDFWKAIYKPKQAYGTQTVTGWIADLFPYLGDAPRRRRNNVLEHPREQWAITVAAGEKSFGGEPGAEKGATGFPSGLCSVPLDIRFPDGSDTHADLIGGFLAIEQSSEDSAISPVIGWCVAEPAPAEPILVV